jgi:16S rRNA processing protein RimM
MSDRIKIGKISAASGLRGEVKLFHDSGEHERLAGIGELFLRAKKDSANNAVGAQGQSPEQEQVTEQYKVINLRFQGKIPILTLEGVTTRSEAEALIGAEVYADKDSLAPLEEDSYYVSDLIGLSVADTVRGDIGKVAGILDNPAHDILRIKPREGSEILLPLIEEFIISIDIDSRLIKVKVPDGLIEE